MVSTPNLDELKEACNSSRLEHCYQFLFMQEAAENEGLFPFSRKNVMLYVVGCIDIGNCFKRA